MGRVFTILVILALLAVVALVPQKSEDAGEPGPDLGDGYAYREDSLARFRLFLEGEGWTLADPPRNAKGMLEGIHEKTGLAFVLVPAGAYLMGSPEEEEGRWPGEGPVHREKVAAFLLGRTECTQSAWERGGGRNESYFKEADRPVETVSWEECRAWCEANGLRLPSESEWEYACRAGTRTPFSTGATLTTDQANYDGNYPYSGASQGEYREQTVAAGSLPANPWGLHEMHGNVWEWCEDAWREGYDGAPTDGTAWTSVGAPLRVNRGGGWISIARICRSAYRYWWPPSFRRGFLGFRPAVSLP